MKRKIVIEAEEALEPKDGSVLRYDAKTGSWISVSEAEILRKALDRIEALERRADEAETKADALRKDVATIAETLKENLG